MECCPGCGRPLGNVIASPQPVEPSPTPTPNYVSYREVSATPPQTPIPQKPRPISPQPIAPEETNYQPRPPVRPVLKLIHVTTGQEFRLPGERGCIGRRSQQKGTVPEIDLTGIPSDDVISRSHAQVFWDWNQKSYMISDTSRNGMYLNGNLLARGINYRLSNGDSLQLGQENLVLFTVVVD